MYEVISVHNTKTIEDAVKSQDLDAVKSILQDKLAIDESDEGFHKLTYCFSLAIEANHISMVSYLLEIHVPFNIHQVRHAVRERSTAIIDLFLAHGWDINEPLDWATPPLLSLAIKDFDLTKYFLSRGANPNARAKILAITPLSSAVAQASFETIKLLFENKGSVHEGQLLHYAAMRECDDRVQVLEYLIEKGAKGINGMMYSDDSKSYMMQQDFGLGTPLHVAVRSGYVDMVRKLLELGADASIRDSNGKLAVDVARRLKNEEMVGLLG